ncbi:MAG: winged helix DNA-binding protein [Alphaproteobacteria bacterium]|nr:winged helix DNA-binding protein [Alphaproteobacteria bacterium]
MKEDYLEAVSLIERLHRRYLEVIKAELDAMKVDDINNVQALVLYNLGNDQISIGELTTKGCYLGSNVSYNLKKMLQSGYVEQMTSKNDRRSYIIKLTSKGMSLCRKLDTALDRHVSSLKDQGIGDMGDFVKTLQKLELFWSNMSIPRTRFNSSRGR